MLCNPYHLVKIEDTAYLVPYGQTAAHLQKCIRLNDTGISLWEGIQKGLTENELFSSILEEYNIDDADKDTVIQDLKQYVQSLKSLGIIQDTQAVPVLKDTPDYFQIGPLTFCMQGHKDLFRHYFSDFACNECTASQNIRIILGEPRKTASGKICLRSEEVIIIEEKDIFILLFPTAADFYEMHLAKDATQANLYCNATVEEEVLFHIIRFAFLLLAQRHGCFVLHSASLLYKEKAWLFSGMSGAGKSTHTALWHDTFHTPLLNGDLNMLGKEGKKFVVYGLPWCGTSKIHTTQNYELGGITFLKKDANNHCSIPDIPQKFLSIVQRLVSPAWTKAMIEANASFAKDLACNTTIFQLSCTKDKEAADVMRKNIDKF